MQVILSPHLDDAILSCWTVACRPNTTVITIFAGTPPKGTTTLWDRLCGEPDSTRMLALRYKENAAILSAIGSQNITLDYLDHQYKQTHPDVKQLADEILELIPPEAEFFAPLAASRLFRHADHVFVRELGLELCRRGRQVTFYADRPYMHLPAKTSKPYLSKLKLATANLLGLDCDVTIINLSKKDQAAKMQSMKSYKTQFFMTNLSGFGSLGRLASIRYEVFIKPQICSEK